VGQRHLVPAAVDVQPDQPAGFELLQQLRARHVGEIGEPDRADQREQVEYPPTGRGEPIRSSG